MVSFRATRQEHLDYAERIAAIPETTIAWFGGWLSADGSIKAHSEKAPKISFIITDADPLDRMSDLFGNAVDGPRKPSANALGSKYLYSWQISGWKAKIILDRVYPWLSLRYKERADVFLNWKPRGHAGRKLQPADVIEIKTALSSGTHGVGKELA